MTYCFISALTDETKRLVATATLVETEELGFAKLHKLSLNGKIFYVCISGVGKVLAGSAAAACCVKHPEIDAYINVGIGGSMDGQRAPVLSVVLGTDFVQHDMDTTAFGDPPGYLWGIDLIKIPADAGLNEKLAKVCEENGVPYCYGSIATGDHFIAEEKDKKIIKERFGSISIDMESAAYAESCYVYHKPYTCIRVISDAANHANDYIKYKPAACDRCSELMLKLLA